MKKVIFLLRGLTREQRHWADFPDHLSKSFPEYEIAFVDLPGFGYANDEKAPFCMYKTSKMILSRPFFKTYEHYDEKIILGLSLGGMCALQMLSDLPDYFDSVVLINSSQRYKNSFLNRFNFSFAPKAFFAYAFGSVKMRETALYDQTINMPRERERYVTDWIGFFKDKPFTKLSCLAQLWAASRFSLKNTKPIVKKGLVLASKRDRLVSWKSSEVLSKILDWPVFYHDNAGHDLTFDDPSWICDKLKSFFN